MTYMNGALITFAAGGGGWGGGSSNITIALISSSYNKICRSSFTASVSIAIFAGDANTVQCFIEDAIYFNCTSAF